MKSILDLKGNFPLWSTLYIVGLENVRKKHKNGHRPSTTSQRRQQRRQKLSVKKYHSKQGVLSLLPPPINTQQKKKGHLKHDRPKN
jgi:hypothetical protein